MNKVGLTEEFIEEVRKDCEIDEFGLVKENCTIINRTQRYIEEYYKQKRKLNYIENYLKKKKGELFEFYKTRYEIKLTSSNDIMIFIEKDDKYQKALEVYSEQKSVVDFLDKTIKNMQNKGFALRNLVELKKGENF